VRRTLVVRSNEICPRCHCLGATVTVMVEQDDEDGTEERIVELVECRANRCLPY
jgi:hypothetical protein